MLGQNLARWLRENRSRVARWVFALDAVLGMLGIGGAALFGAAYASGNVWTTVLAIFVPGALLWGAFCYGAYRGLTSANILLNGLFWIFVAGNVFAFPVGTAIAALSIWLWRAGRSTHARSAPPLI